MRKLVTLAAIAALTIGAAVAGGCKRELVEVQSGTQVVCTYGEVVSEDVETVRVPANRAGEYSVKTTSVTCPRHLKLQELYAEAQKALASGDTKTAAKKLAEITAVDPSYRKAADQAAAIKSGKKPAPDTDPEDSGTGAGTPGGDPAAGTPGPGNPSGGDEDDGPEPVGPVVNLVRYVPDTIPGFTALAIISDPLSLSRMYRPTGGGDVGSLVIAADQYKDSGHAQRMLVSQVQRPYPSSASEVTVGGKNGYFGTDGHRFAVVAFRDGAAVVLFEMMSKSSDPVGLKDELVAVADVVF